MIMIRSWVWLIMGWGDDLWSGNVEPPDVLGHPCREASGECRYLFVDVHEEGVGGPASLFVDSVTWDAVKVHGHGTPHVQGVAADTGGRETFFVEPCGDDGGLEHLVDVT